MHWRRRASQKGDDMTNKTTNQNSTSLIVRGLLLTMLLACFVPAAYSQVITFTPPDPGPPFYTVLEPGFVPHTEEWAAIIFVRETGCVPPGFNLITVVNIPAVFGCPLTVEGHAIW